MSGFSLLLKNIYLCRVYVNNLNKNKTAHYNVMNNKTYIFSFKIVYITLLYDLTSRLLVK